MNKHICPVCGYRMDVPAANYNICASCGTEFGLHDQNATLDELRLEWIRTGPTWWSKTEPRPDNWSPFVQLANVSLTSKALTSSSFDTPEPEESPLRSGTEFHVEPKPDYFDWAGRAWGRQSEDKQHASV